VTAASPSTASAARGNGRGAGGLLRDWRIRRRYSQLDLALAANVSARHLSFVETGRSQPSRELLLALADSLDIPLRERNTMLLAAGYAPTYTVSDLADEDMRAVRSALEHLLAGHEPFPALVVDRYGDVQLANRPVGWLLGDLAPALLTPPTNIYRLSLHPDGLAPRIRNLAEWATHLTDQLARQAHLTDDPKLVALLDEVRAYPTTQHTRHTHGAPAHGVLLALHLEHPRGELHLHSTMTNFGAPHDVTLAELSVESFFPADDSTRAILHSLADTPHP
jgi:transcriptional regulator with XRE-family HTH domain